MRVTKYLQTGLIAVLAALFVGSGGPLAGSVLAKDSRIASRTRAAVHAFSDAVRPLSHPKALETALRSYYAFKAAHPDEVSKAYLYFVDYGLPSRKPRGYVFDMRELKVLDGPFAVAH